MQVQGIVECFNRGVCEEKGNTVSCGDALILHGNRIAGRHPSRGVFVDTCGWNTAVTRRRLNAIDGVRVWVEDGDLYLNGWEWHGDLVFIDDWDIMHMEDARDEVQDEAAELALRMAKEGPFRIMEVEW